MLLVVECNRVVIAITIYVDVLISINLIIDYLLISLTSKLLKTYCRLWRQILGALTGGITSLSIMLPIHNVLGSFFVRLVTAVLVVTVTYGIGKLTQFLRKIACFYIVSFLFSGVMFGVWFFLKPKGLFMQNGIVYYNISTIFLVLSGVLSYLIISLISRFVKRGDAPLRQVEVLTKNSFVKLTVLIDSGNSLREPFSEKPVLLLDPRYEFLLKEYDAKKRVIPYKTVSGEGVIFGVRPKAVYLCEGGREALDVYIAVSPESLGEYEGVLGSCAI